MRRLAIGELQVGTPLPFDVFDSDHRLLLRRGNRISSDSQLERLVRQGIFYGESTKDGTGGRQDAAPPIEPADIPPSRAPEVSAFRLLDDCVRDLDELLRTTSTHLNASTLEREVRYIAARIQRLCRSDSDAALANMLLGQAPHYAIRQQINVAILSALMLARMPPGTVHAEEAVCAALTMNLGMLDLQEELYWVDRPLDEAQRAAVEQHPTVSAQMLRDLGVEDPVWLETVEQHHEAQDGSGYPRALQGTQQCTEARVIALADRYNGMVSNRAYRCGITPDVALKKLAQRDARATDPELLGLLLRVIGVYPPGTVVALLNKEVGVVTNRLLDLTHPIVHTFYVDPYWPYGKPVKRFTARMPQFGIVRTLSRDEVNLRVDPDQFWPPTSIIEPAPHY